MVAEIDKYGRVRAAWPGMQVQAVTPYLAQRLGYSDVRGLVVTRVDAGGPAAAAGRAACGDRIRKVNGTVTNSRRRRAAQHLRRRVGDQLKLGARARRPHARACAVKLAESAAGDAVIARYTPPGDGRGVERRAPPRAAGSTSSSR